MSRTKRDARQAGRAPVIGRTAWWAGATVLTLAVVAIVAWQAGATDGGLPPDFALVAYQGQELFGGDEARFHDVVGQGTPVVLNFWAASCPPCREEMPGFQQVADEYGDAVRIIGVDIGTFTFLGTSEEARAFLHEYDIRYPAAYAVDEQVVRDYEVRGMPTTLFFDADGRQVSKHTGFLPLREFRAQVDELVGGGG